KRRWKRPFLDRSDATGGTDTGPTALDSFSKSRDVASQSSESSRSEPDRRCNWPALFRSQFAVLKLAAIAVTLAWIFYATVAQLVWIPLPTFPVTALEPFRIANRYGLFAVMTRGRYEIEYHGSEERRPWGAYP